MARKQIDKEKPIGCASKERGKYQLNNGILRLFSYFFLCLILIGIFPGLILGAEIVQGPKSSDIKRALIVLSSSYSSYEECADGIEEFLKDISLSLEIERLTIDQARMYQNIREEGHVIVFPVGSEAAEFAADRFSQVPVVFSMVLDPPEELLARPNVYGVCLDLPAYRYIAWFREMIPDFRVLGVLYTASSLHKVKEIRRDVMSTGVKLVALRVDDLADLPSRLDELSLRVQALLALPDELLYNRVIAPRIIYYCIKNRLPFAGLSVNFTRAGALFSLDVDYRRMGRKAARMGLAILKGARVRARLQHPDSIIPHLNLRTAQLIGLQLDNELISKFKIVAQ